MRGKISPKKFNITTTNDQNDQSQCYIYKVSTLINICNGKLALST